MTLFYYHKILIQYIYLSYAKNDLVKIGESILDYIEFLIKFKFKTSSDDKYFMKIKYKNSPEFQNKQNMKKIIFDKIIKWFDLFNLYLSYVKENSTLDDNKSIVDTLSHGLNSENDEFNLESQGSFMFKINIQKSEFLKGKFCLYCKNYNDALFYFIRAVKKKSIVIDGLIKKRSLKHINKILIKMKKKYNKYGLNNLSLEQEMKELKKHRNNLKRNTLRKFRNSLAKVNKIKGPTFKEEIEKIKNDITNDINECDEKQKKDILILIDFNLYNKNSISNLSDQTNKIDSFIEETNIILKDYLSTSDRFCVLIYSDKYQIVCPLMEVNNIDSNSFSKELFNLKNKLFHDKKESEESDINPNEFKEDFSDFNLDENNLNEFSQEDSFEPNDSEENNYEKLNGLLKSINYLIDYSKIKEGVKNEKYIIIFTDFLNITFNEEEQVKKVFEILERDDEVILLLIRKTTNLEINNNQILENLFLSKFGEKSEIIGHENTKKIKEILSNNNIIRDEIIYPNEIYK